MSDSNPFSPVSESLLHEAWDWLEDCGIVDEDNAEDANEGVITAADVIRMVQKCYEGGWAAFCKDATPKLVWSLVSEKRDSKNNLLGVTEQNNIDGKRRYRACV